MQGACRGNHAVWLQPGLYAYRGCNLPYRVQKGPCAGRALFRRKTDCFCRENPAGGIGESGDSGQIPEGERGGECADRFFRTGQSDPEKRCHQHRNGGRGGKIFAGADIDRIGHLASRGADKGLLREKDDRFPAGPEQYPAALRLSAESVLRQGGSQGDAGHGVRGACDGQVEAGERGKGGGFPQNQSGCPQKAGVGNHRKQLLLCF